MRDLAPLIHRQRLVIEGIPDHSIESHDIVGYLSELSEVLDMMALTRPVTHLSPKFGWAGWIHWETSGAHFYAWDEPLRFFSVDVYTCKAFDPGVAVEFTRTYLRAVQIEHRQF